MHARLPPPVSAALRCERGTTLIELLVVGGLLSVVVAAAALFLPTALRLSAADAARVDALDRGGQAMARLKADVRQARDVRMPAAEVLEVDVLSRVPGAPGAVRTVRWDCSLVAAGLRACRREDPGATPPVARWDGIAADGQPILGLRRVAGRRAVVDVRLPMRTSGSRGPAVVASSASPRACFAGGPGCP